MNKILTGILTLIFAGGALSEILNWLGITPKHITNNKLILLCLSFLNFKISLYWVSFIILITVLMFYKLLLKNPKTLSNEKNKKTEKTDKKLEAMNLSEEQQFFLLFLLEQSSKSFLRHRIEEEYKLAFSKATSDFNIIEEQLRELDLIEVHHYAIGTHWVLTKRGLKLASIIHNEVQSK